MSREIRHSEGSRRILMIVPYGGVGGMERLALHMYRHYRSLGDTAKVIKLVRLPDDFINFGEDEIALSDRDLTEMPAWRRLIFYLSIPFAIARAVRRHGITHSIGFGDMGNLFSSVSPSREFKVASIHSIKSMELANPAILNRLFRFAYRTSYRRFNRVVCISRAIMVDLLTRCGYAFPHNLEVVYNAHDVPGIVAAAKAPLDPGEEKLFSSKTIMFVGRITQAKAPWHLLKAFHLVLERGVQARLLVVGDGNPVLTAHMHALASRLGIAEDVVFLGRRENPYRYLARADVLALSSHFEGTPNVIVEAIALGVPVVSSYCTDGIIELMSSTAVTRTEAPFEFEAGIVTPSLVSAAPGVSGVGAPATPAETAFADALCKVLNSPSYRHAVCESRDQLLAKFDLAESARAYLAPSHGRTARD